MIIFPQLSPIGGMVPFDNHFITPFSPSNVEADPGISANRLYCIPIRIPIACKVIELGVNVSAIANFAQKMVMGIYDFDLKTGNPINLLAQAIGEIALNSGTGYKSIPIDLSLDPGIFYIIYNTSSGGIVAQFKQPFALVDPILPFLLPTVTAYTTHKTVNLTYNAILPIVAPTPTVESTSLVIATPIMKVRTI